LDWRFVLSEVNFTGVWFAVLFAERYAKIDYRKWTIWEMHEFHTGDEGIEVFFTSAISMAERVRSKGEEE
jgi:hypothetical protein